MPNIRPISPALAKKAEIELNEVPERIQEDLDAFKTWIAKQPHLKARTDDQFLVTFLRGCKYSLERAKEKLDMFYTVRSALPEVFENRDPADPRMLEIIRMGIGLPLPHTITPDGPRLMVIRTGIYDPNKYTVQEVMKVATMANDILMLEDDNFTIAGQVGVMDMTYMTMSHFLQFSPSLMKKMTMLNQEASPFRQKGFHYIHTPSTFETLFNVFKGFLNDKIRSRLYVHGDNLESLYQQVPQRLLPVEYGGEAGPIQDIIDEWEKKFLSYREYFMEDSKYGTDEKKRPGRPKNAESLFGLDGTFRMLNVD